MFNKVFGTNFDFFIVLPVLLKTCRFNVFFCFTGQNVRVRKIERIAKVLRASKVFFLFVIFICFYKITKLQNIFIKKSRQKNVKFKKKMMNL